MRIAYCTNVRLPSERAHGHQVAQVTDALNRLGHAVTIFAPWRKNVVGRDFWDYYGIPRAVKLTYAGSFDPIASPFLPGVIGLKFMNFILRRELGRKLNISSFDLAYTRSPALLPAMVASGVPVILELHQLPRFGRGKFVSRCNRLALIVPLTRAMAEVLESWGVEKSRIFVSGDAVDLKRFQSQPSSKEARAQFGVNTGRVIVGYVGRLKTLGMEKGVSDLLKAVKADRRFFAFIVGGPENDRQFYSSQAAGLGLGAEDFKLTGEIPSATVPAALAACDILAMPFPDLPHYRRFMSPLKMFEYMASGKPIVTSDLPTVRDVLSEETAFFCEPGNYESLLKCLKQIESHPEEAHKRAARALEVVKDHTWEARMAGILRQISQ